MLKRLYSKRSGFTLVEIIVAFAVFSIMASMICQVLEFSVRARQSNNAYQRELDTQEQLLTLIEKKSEDFKNEDGRIKISLPDGTEVDLPYDRLSAMVDAEFDSEGLNYFISNVNYQSNGEVMPGPGDTGSAGTNTGSQASRMDTRITGTGGIESIQILHVTKDTNSYAAGDPYAIPAGHTRYFITCCASSGGLQKTLKAEDVPYAQYRLHFYCCPDPDKSDDDPTKMSEALNAALSSVEYKDEEGRTYTKEVYKEALITKVGYIKNYEKAVSEGLKSSNIMSSYDNLVNRYTVEQMGTNTIRIGSPFITDSDDPGLGGRGVRFQMSNISRFYVEFNGDPHISVDSFGHNAVKGVTEGSKKYTPCPVYLEKFEDDGTPEYDYESDTHVNIYGAFLHKRNYKN